MECQRCWAVIFPLKLFLLSMMLNMRDGTHLYKLYNSVSWLMGWHNSKPYLFRFLLLSCFYLWHMANISFFTTRLIILPPPSQSSIFWHFPYVSKPEFIQGNEHFLKEAANLYLCTITTLNNNWTIRIQRRKPVFFR